MSNFEDKMQDQVLETLRSALHESDPSPDQVGEFARALYTWREIDAELAELSFDSSEEELPIGVRSSAVARIVSFQAGRWLVDIEFDESRSLVMGRVSPDADYTVEMHSRGARFLVESEASAFEIEGIAPGPVSLVFRFSGGETVKTSWVTL